MMKLDTLYFWQYSLQDVSFEVHPGQVVALVGPSGGGKSTVVKLIEHFYELSSGRVLIGTVLLSLILSQATPCPALMCWYMVFLKAESGLEMRLTVWIAHLIFNRDVIFCYLGNQDIRELDPKWYRHHIGFVSQEPVLFACSIADNISYGREDATKEDVSMHFTTAFCTGMCRRNISKDEYVQ